MADLSVADDVAATLAPFGWHFVGPELDQWPWRRFFVKVMDERRRVHLHLMTVGDPRWDEQLAFRDQSAVVSSPTSPKLRVGYVWVMGVTRIVANLPVTDVASASTLYAQIFGLGVGMDLGWVGNLAPAEAPAVQLQVLTSDASAPCNPAISVGVAAPSEVDAIHERVVAAALEIVHPLTDEDWGVRRFFFRDYDGNVINVVANR